MAESDPASVRLNRAAKPVTLADVAESAGVAVGTASRVMNNFTDVSPEARQKVLDSVARLKYRPLRRRTNAANGKSAKARPRSIGLVLLGMTETLVHVPVLSEMLHGIESAVTEDNGNLLLANLPRADRVPAFVRNNQVEGLILKTSQYQEFPGEADNQLMKVLQRFPLVWVWAKPEGARGDLCSFNHETAARIAARFLLDRGHRRVAYLNPKKGKSSLEHLKKEFRCACSDASLELTLLESASPQVATWPEPALTGPEDLFPLVDSWCGLPARRRPTAIFVPADNIAGHLYHALEARGLMVGRDVSVMACNNEKSLVSVLKPTLTTIEVNAHEIGRKAVDQLIWRIAHPTDAHTQTILFEPTLCPGDSVADLNA